jgi:hypothetical protein
MRVLGHVPVLFRRLCHFFEIIVEVFQTQQREYEDQCLFESDSVSKLLYFIVMSAENAEHPPSVIRKHEFEVDRQGRQPHLDNLPANRQPLKLDLMQKADSIERHGQEVERDGDHLIKQPL